MPIPSTTLEGRLTDDPQRNQRNPNLVEFSIAEGTRYQDKKTGEWKDGQTLFARCKVWDTTLGNNIMNTLRKGMDVVALADVKQNSWTDQQTGQKRSMVEFTVTNIGVGLRHATAQVMPNPKRNGGYDGGNHANVPQNNGQTFQNPNNPSVFQNPNNYGADNFQPAASNDPWGAPMGNPAPVSQNDEPEF